MAVVGDAVEVEGCRVPACNDQVEGPCIRVVYEENSFWVRGQGEGGYRVAYLAAVSIRASTELVDVDLGVPACGGEEDDRGRR